MADARFKLSVGEEVGRSGTRLFERNRLSYRLAIKPGTTPRGLAANPYDFDKAYTGLKDAHF